MILVVGATGTVGREVVRLLTSAGRAVRALVRTPERAAWLTASPHLEIAYGNLDDPESLYPAVAGVEKLFLVSSAGEGMVLAQATMAEVARQSGVKHIVKLSALGADPVAPSVLQQAHWQAEQRVSETGIAYTHLRPNFFMQNLLALTVGIHGEGMLYSPMGQGRVSMVDARDIARLVVAVLLGTGHERQIYDITGPEALSLTEVATKVAHATERSVAYADVPLESARQTMLSTGMSPWMAEGIVALYASYAEGMAAQVTDTIARISDTTPTTFDQFAQHYAPVFKGQAAYPSDTFH